MAFCVSRNESSDRLLDNMIEGNGSSGVYGRGNGTFTIQDNTIINNTGRGVEAVYATYVITGNTIVANGGGISISQAGSYTITDNAILRNVSADGSAFLPSGAWSNPVTLQRNVITQNTCTNTPTCSTILTFQPNSGDPAFVLSNNNIFGNTATYELFNQRGVALSDIQAENNWWGTTNETEIKAKIYDFSDDGTKGIVDYSPFLISPDTTAPVSPPTGVIPFHLVGAIK